MSGDKLLKTTKKTSSMSMDELLAAIKEAEAQRDALGLHIGDLLLGIANLGSRSDRDWYRYGRFGIVRADGKPVEE